MAQTLTFVAISDTSHAVESYWKSTNRIHWFSGTKMETDTNNYRVFNYGNEQNNVITLKLALYSPLSMGKVVNLAVKRSLLPFFYLWC